MALAVKEKIKAGFIVTCVEQVIAPAYFLSSGLTCACAMETQQKNNIHVVDFFINKF